MTSRLCVECQQVIHGKYMETQGQRFHPECLKCQSCQTEITGPIGFYNDKRMCGECMEAAYKLDLPSCGKCHEVIQGLGVTWHEEKFHKACFTCHGCGVELHDRLVYLNEEGKRICQACIPARVCVVCNENLEGESVVSEGKHYHARCFERSEETLCSGCNKAVGPREQLVTVENENFHLACFTCAQCKGPMQQYFAQDGQRVCGKCVHWKTCARCQQQIEDEVLVAYGKTYHCACFVCQMPGCEANLRDGFFAYLDQLVCTECDRRKSAGNNESVLARCRRCGKAVGAGGLIPVGKVGEVYHSKCFVCEVCDKPLEPFNVEGDGQWACQESKYMCPDCVTPLLPSISTLKGIRSCIRCSRKVPKGPNFMGLWDGRCVHMSCFKCCTPGCEAPYVPSAQETTLVACVDALAEGRFFCQRCVAERRAAPPPRPASEKTDLRMELGAYMGRVKWADSIEDVIALKLMAGAKFWFGRGSTLDERAWEVEGTYDEKWDLAGRVIRVLLSVVNSAGRSPHQLGDVVELLVIAGGKHRRIVYDRIRCDLQVGINDQDLRAAMKPPRNGR